MKVTMQEKGKTGTESVEKHSFAHLWHDGAASKRLLPGSY
jgi:hypothetical protein